MKNPQKNRSGLQLQNQKLLNEDLERFSRKNGRVALTRSDDVRFFIQVFLWTLMAYVLGALMVLSHPEGGFHVGL